MASCVRNTRTKNYQDPIIAFKVTVENVGVPVFLRHSVVHCLNMTVNVKTFSRLSAEWIVCK